MDYRFDFDLTIYQSFCFPNVGGILLPVAEPSGSNQKTYCKEMKIVQFSDSQHKSNPSFYFFGTTIRAKSMKCPLSLHQTGLPKLHFLYEIGDDSVPFEILNIIKCFVWMISIYSFL